MNQRAAQEVSLAYQRSELMLWLSNILILISAIVTSAMIYLVMIRRTVQPETALTTAMRVLADGDTSVDIPETHSRDEIAEMIAAVKVFRVNAVARDRLELEREKHTAELDKKNKQLADELEIARQMQLSIFPPTTLTARRSSHSVKCLLHVSWAGISTTS
jgi:methyl-accepting chemotaxis protein